MIALPLALALAATSPPPAPVRSQATAAGHPPAASPGSRPAPPPTHVDADHIEYRYKEHRTVMTGKPLVTLTRQDAILVCKRLTAENDEAGDIRRAVCEGDVKLTQGERIVTCARATYDAAAARVVCRGDPVLRDGASVMRCEEVVYDLDQDRVELKQGKGTIVPRPGQEPLAGRKASP